ncbi:MAG: Tad domain-containing protein [Bacteroidota bacterium]
MNRPRVLPPEGGQALVLYALMLFVLIGMAALVVDVGRAYAERRFMQNGTDAGALAAAGHLASLLAPCDPDVTTNCVDGLVYRVSEDELFKIARGAVYANQSGLGYVDPGDLAACPGTPSSNRNPSVTVQYYRWGDVNLYDVGCGVTDLIPGDAYKIVVTAHTDWQAWIAGAIGQQNVQAGARSVAQIAGMDEDSGPLWPMVRRRSVVQPSSVSPGPPYTFWSPNIAGDEDGTSGSFKATVSFGMYSNRNNGPHTGGYSPKANPKIQPLDASKTPSSSVWTTKANQSGHSGCGFWDTRANQKECGFFAVEDNLVDLPNWFHYGFSGTISLENEWWEGGAGNLDCGGLAPRSCQVPNQSEFASLADGGDGYALGPVPSDYHRSVGGRWPAAGDWVETYSGNLGANIGQQIRDFIDRNPAPNCPYSSLYGPCVYAKVYLWEGGQVYANGEWHPWTEDGNDEVNGPTSTPDRVHLVDVWMFVFYKDLVESSGMSRVQGFFVSKGIPGPVDGDPGKPSRMANHYFLVND